MKLVRQLLCLGSTILIAVVLAGCVLVDRYPAERLQVVVEGRTSKIVVQRRLTNEELQCCSLAMELAATLAPELRRDNWREAPLYWMAAGNGYEGITHFKDGRPWRILLNEQLRPKKKDQQHGSVLA
ncbi:MAG: hypothetical protein EBU46_00060 [Nitrosomonadaceae bacterium]|nr:hypothetical protein [Nitrosomonadaceae bacterium]